MTMNPIDVSPGYSMPRQGSVVQVSVRTERRRSSIKNIFRKRPRSDRKGSKARNASIASVGGSSEDDAESQDQSLFFARLPLEIRLQIYEEVFGENIYHFRTIKEVYSFRCPRGSTVTKAGRLVFMECDYGHPWIERPLSLKEAQAVKDPAKETRPAMLKTCRLAYLEASEQLYRKSKFIFAGPDTFLMWAKSLSPFCLENVSLLELRAPDMLVWQLRLTHPKENRAGYNEWLQCITTVKQMTNLRSLYVIVPNALARFERTRRKHSVELERNLLGQFENLQAVPNFVVWIAWYDDGGEGYPAGDKEAEQYAFKVVRFPTTNYWPKPLLREDET